METTSKKTDTPKDKAKKENTPKKVSKTWLAVEKLKGTGKILDMKAVLK